jgi:hypothetical protein
MAYLDTDGYNYFKAVSCIKRPQYFTYIVMANLSNLLSWYASNKVQLVVFITTISQLSQLILRFAKYVLT